MKHLVQGSRKAWGLEEKRLKKMRDANIEMRKDFLAFRISHLFNQYTFGTSAKYVPRYNFKKSRHVIPSDFWLDRAKNCIEGVP